MKTKLAKKRLSRFAAAPRALRPALPPAAAAFETKPPNEARLKFETTEMWVLERHSAASGRPAPASARPPATMHAAIPS